MDIIPLILLSAGLSMDSLAIAMTSGAILGNHIKTNVLKIAGMLAFVQMILTIIGWFIGSTFVKYINQYDHWLAFGILSVLGIKVIIESFKKDKNEKPAFNPLNFKVMLGLAIAASIDATAVGLSLSLVNQPIIQPAIIIGCTTFIMSAFGVIFGCKAGQKYNKHINLIGGLILILIACLILANHTIWADSSHVSILSTNNIL